MARRPSVPKTAATVRRKGKTASDPVRRAERSEALELFWKQVSHLKDEDSLFSLALSLLSQILGKIEAAVFVWDTSDYCLRCEKILHGSALQDGEEIIPLSKDSPLWGLYTGVMDLVFDPQVKASLCVALRIEGEFLGMLRITRLSGRDFSAINLSQIRLFCGELTYAMSNLRLFIKNEEHVRQLRASFEISSNIVKSLHLGELLELIVKSIGTHLGFDRVRLYLVNTETNTLNGEVAYDLRGQSTSLARESYPLQAGVHPLVDHILGRHDKWVQKTFHDVVVTVPLQMKNRVIGLLAVDNILSQQRIGMEEIQTIQSFAGQIAMAVENARLFQRVEELSVTDSLTDLFVLRHFKERIQTEVYRCKRYGGSLALFMLDVDDFKPVNDTYGHGIGDTVLKWISGKIRAVLRQTDFACRYGGDEFMLCFTNMDTTHALESGRRLLDSLAVPPPIKEAPGLQVHVSIGVSLFPDNSENIDEVFRQADQALYAVKNKGKHQILGWWELNP